MRKRITTIALVAALAASQSVCTFAANSPGTGPVISERQEAAIMTWGEGQAPRQAGQPPPNRTLQKRGTNNMVRISRRQG